MKNINIVENNGSTSIGKIKLYKDIFGEEPWNEGFICTKCDSIFPKTFMGSCTCGNSQIEPIYKNMDLKKNFNELSLKNNYQELVANILDIDVGFIFGWNSSLSELNISKLKLNNEELEELERLIKAKYSDFNIEDFYYFAEIGVKKDFRGEDIAGTLYRKNLEAIKNRGEKYILVRTTKLSDKPYKWFLKEGYEEVFSYNDEQDRVILVNKI